MSSKLLVTMCKTLVSWISGSASWEEVQQGLLRPWSPLKSVWFVLALLPELLAAEAVRRKPGSLLCRAQFAPRCSALSLQATGGIL